MKIKSLLNMIGKKSKKYLSVSILTMTLNGLASLLVTVLILQMASMVLNGSSERITNFWWLLGGTVIIKTLINSLTVIFMHFATFEITQSIKRDIILRLKKFSLGYYSNERIGEINKIVHNDADDLGGNLGFVISQTVSDMILAGLIGLGLFLVSWKLALTMISLLPIAILILVHGIKKNAEMKSITQERLTDMVSLFIEFTRGIPLLKAFSESNMFKSKLEYATLDFSNASKNESTSHSKYLGSYFVLVELSFALLAGIGAYLLFGGEISVTQYLIFIIFSKYFYRPFIEMQGTWVNYLKVKESYERINQLMVSPTIEDVGHIEKLKSYNIEFKNVYFSYDEGKEHFGLKNINLNIDEGSLTALVGPSGSGKTTMTNLLLRFWDVNKGQILIGGQNIKDIKYDDLLAQTSIVMQKVILFADTIYENIKLGNVHASREQVVEAAKKAMIHDFIESLPQGYDTPIGENGVGLSGGQKQRISIARAILKDAPIIILDEFTSSVDPINEMKIQKAISNMAKNKTVIVIAHHLNTIANADQIVVFENGEIIEYGKHSALIESKQLYSQLWDAQQMEISMENVS